MATAKSPDPSGDGDLGKAEKFLRTQQRDQGSLHPGRSRVSQRSHALRHQTQHQRSNQSLQIEPYQRVSRKALFIVRLKGWNR
jgi:hypothetical protein